MGSKQKSSMVWSGEGGGVGGFLKSKSENEILPHRRSGGGVHAMI